MTPVRSARILRPTRRNLERVAELLRKGHIVGVPSETVYGLAGHALDPAACAKIFLAKGRPAHDPLIVHVHSLPQLDALCVMNPAAERLADAFWPGPLTMVLKKKPIVPDIVSAGRKSVAIRMPAHPVFRKLLQLAKVSVAAPSANPFGYISPTTAEHVRDSLGARIAYIVDGGPARIGVESTIVDLRNPKAPKLLRPGGVNREDLERVLGLKISLGRRRTPARDGAAQLAPGMLARHYSPRTPVILHDTGTLRPRANRDEAFVLLRKPTGRAGANVYWLDARGDLRGAARRLFATLRKIDALKFRRIHVERAPAEGLGAAINDRLQRAAAR